MNHPIDLYRGPADRSEWPHVLLNLQNATQNEPYAQTSFCLEFVLEEWFINVCTHGNEIAGRMLQVWAQLKESPTSWVLVLNDDGTPFDPTQHPAPDTNAPLEERAVGGLGLFLSEQMAQQISYRRLGEHNELTLTLQRPS